MKDKKFQKKYGACFKNECYSEEEMEAMTKMMEMMAGMRCWDRAFTKACKGHIKENLMNMASNVLMGKWTSHSILQCENLLDICKDLETKEFSQIILHLTYSTSKNSLMIMNIIAMIKQVAGRSFNCIDNEFLSGLSKVISTAGKWSFTLFAISIYPICSFLGIFSNMLVRFVARLYPNTIEMRT